MNIHFRTYITAYIRGFLYGTCAFLSAFIAQFKEMTPEHMLSMNRMNWAVCWAEILLATAIVMKAYFDGTIERIKNDQSFEEVSATAAPMLPASQTIS